MSDTWRSVAIGLGAGMIGSAFYSTSDPGFYLLALGIILVAAGLRP